MRSNHLRTLISLVFALLVLSFVNASAVPQEAVDSLNGNVEHFTRAAAVQDTDTKTGVSYWEDQIAKLDAALASFQGQLATFLRNLSGALHQGTRSSQGHFRAHSSPKLSSSTRSFNPFSTRNIAVYYGQTPLTTSTNLLELCSDPSITIVNLAFLSTFFGPNGYPTTSFGPACNAPQNKMQKSKAPGLQNCAELGQQVLQCQAQGKVVLVSLGGYIASSSFPSAASARQFARTIWNLFGAGTGDDPRLRPLGPGVIVDGFDIDNEDHSPIYYNEFVDALKRRYKSSAALASGKKYYLSSTPQCPRPDASIPLEVMRRSDWVNVQFYNNPACNLDTGIAFLESFEAWSSDLAGSKADTRLLIAAPAWPGAGSGYVPGSNLKGIVKKAKKGIRQNANFGGIAMWDGVEGLANVDAKGVNFVQYAAEALS